ncbi:MAG TPA: hypothetical protein VM911_02220 [Pyrinomonadaceae bacterium]|nr:hypothetical protein [Pyrinomonadaceae bacterium]
MKKTKLGIVLALIFVLNFGSLVFAQNSNSSTTTSTTTTTRTNSRGMGRRSRRRMRRRLRRHARRRARARHGNMGNGNTRR